MLHKPGELAFKGKQLHVCVKSWWVASGLSKDGRTAYRGEEAVECKHKHKTEGSAKKCVMKMRLEKVGDCRQYQATIVSEWKPVSS